MKGNNIKEIRETLEGYFQEKHPEIEVAYIFGSIAQETTNVLSDVDIAIILDKEQINELSSIYPYRLK